MPATGFGGMQVLGAALLVLALLILVATARRTPATAFGVAWLAIALGPVHNVLVPTGIVMAERTLFLGSIGFLFGSVALLAAGYRALVSNIGERAIRLLVGAAVGALVIMGVSRSSSRQQVWSDLPTLWRQTLIDAPLSYRAHHAYAQVLFRGGARGQAETHYRRAIELHPEGWPIYVDLADKYRLEGQCWPAIDLYQALLELNPEHAGGRGSLVACLVFQGRFEEAAVVARAGIEIEDTDGLFTRYAEIADSAARVGADPSQVKLPVPDSTRKSYP